MCSVLIHRQGFPHQGTFTVMRHFELSGKADAVLFYRDGVPAASTHPIVGDWIIDQVADSYVSALVIVREDGTPRLSVLTRFDKYGGLMTDTA
jgi:hypothetical protein